MLINKATAASAIVFFMLLFLDVPVLLKKTRNVNAGFNFLKKSFAIQLKSAAWQ